MNSRGNNTDLPDFDHYERGCALPYKTQRMILQFFAPTEYDLAWGYEPWEAIDLVFLRQNSFAINKDKTLDMRYKTYWTLDWGKPDEVYPQIFQSKLGNVRGATSHDGYVKLKHLV